MSSLHSLKRLRRVGNKLKFKREIPAFVLAFSFFSWAVIPLIDSWTLLDSKREMFNRLLSRCVYSLKAWLFIYTLHSIACGCRFYTVLSRQLLRIEHGMTNFFNVCSRINHDRSASKRANASQITYRLYDSLLLSVTKSELRLCFKFNGVMSTPKNIHVKTVQTCCFIWHR